MNPQNLKNNHWLHYWGIKSTSPYKNGVVLSKLAPSVTSVTVTPSAATVSQGASLKLAANVVTQGFANKGVIWSIESADGETEENPVTIKQDGTVNVPVDYDNTKTITIRATSVYDNTKYADSIITVAKITA